MKNPQVELSLGKRYLVNVGEALDDSMKLSLLRQLHERQSARISYILKDDDKFVGTGFVSIRNAAPIAEVRAIEFEIPFWRPINYDVPPTPNIRTLQKGDNNFLTLDAVYFLGQFLSSPYWHSGDAVTHNEDGSVDSRLLFVSGYLGSLYGSRGVYTPDSEDDGIIYGFWSPLGKSPTEPRNEYPLSMGGEKVFNLIDNLVIGIRKTRSPPVRLKTGELYGELLSAKSL